MQAAIDAHRRQFRNVEKQRAMKVIEAKLKASSRETPHEASKYILIRHKARDQISLLQAQGTRKNYPQNWKILCNKCYRIPCLYCDFQLQKMHEFQRLAVLSANIYWWRGCQFKGTIFIEGTMKHTVKFGTSST